jgi:hypothetical protein
MSAWQKLLRKWWHSNDEVKGVEAAKDEVEQPTN